MPLTRLLCLSLAVSCIGGACNSDPPIPPLASVKDCQGGWQPLIAPRDRDGAYSLEYGNGELIYSAASPRAQGPLVYQIEAQPIGGGEPRIIGPAVARDLWVVGDQVYYALGDTLQRIPLQGGPSTLLVGHDPANGDLAGFSDDQLLGPDTFYWNEEYTPGGFRLLAAPREGGQSRLVADVQSPSVVSAMALAADAVIAADILGNGTAIPLDGSAPRILANRDYRNLSGVDAKGVYGYQLVSPVDADVERYGMTLAPIDGGAAQPFWPDMPPRVAPVNIWPDGDRGWLVSASETLDDGLPHASVFFVDSAGQGTRVACEPTGAEVIRGGRPAFTSDAAYVVSQHLTRLTWSIVRVPRP
jgi:hypothetical protein